MILHKSSVTLYDCLCNKLIFIHKKLIPKNISNFFFTTFNGIAFIYKFIFSYVTDYSYQILTKVYLYNITRSLLLNSWTSKIKKKKVCCQAPLTSLAKVLAFSIILTMESKLTLIFMIYYKLLPLYFDSSAIDDIS